MCSATPAYSLLLTITSLLLGNSNYCKLSLIQQGSKDRFTMQSIKVKDYMTLRAVTFKINMTITEASERLLIANQTGGPVLDEHQHVVGFLSEQDCLERMLEDTYQNESHYKVVDVMRTDVLSIDETHSVLDLAQTMLTNKPKIFPVVDNNKRFVGVITRSDILRAINNHQTAMYSEGHGRFV